MQFSDCRKPIESSKLKRETITSASFVNTSITQLENIDMHFIMK